ncbi:MAG: apolipoprotein N-acyltransferase [Thermodesulfobacteriota bacterium]|nr:apolipoprotein N-acyltransferase [Thermodesulfobacteriota bacterium]
MTTLVINKKICAVSLRDAGLAAVSGLLLSASFPKVDCPFLAWVAFLPLFHAIKGKSPQVSFKIGFLAGLVHYATLLYWIAGVMETYGQLPVVVSWSILFLLVIYLSLYPAAFALLVAHLRTRSGAYLWSAPFLWVALEYMRAFLLSGFPWENLGYSQYSQLHLIQISDILGVYGLSALVVAVNAALFELWGAIRQKNASSWKPILAVALAVAGFLSYGTWRISKVERIAKGAPKRTVALVQGNIDQTKKWLPSFQGETVQRYGRLSLAVLQSRPDLIVWPETALPFYFLHDEALTRQVVELVRACGVHFLVGSPSFCTCGQEMHWYNSAYLLNPAGEVLGKYDKVHLVPYGEYIPLKRFFPFLGKLVKAVGDFKPGTKGHLLSLEDEKLGVLICFEVIFPDLARAMCQKGAQLLVSITNDAWFGTSSAPYQHLSMAVFRAVENHIALARAANTGISAFIDPVGRIFDSTPLFEEAVRARPLPMMGEKTLYARFGDLFAAVCVLASLVMCLWPFRCALFGNRS